MKREFGNLEEAVNFISTKMALKKIKDDSNNEKEPLNDQENLKRLMLEKNKNEVQVKERINAIYNTIIKENPLIEFPQGFLVDVGNFVAVQVKEKGLSTPEQISTSSIITKELVEKIYNENYEIVDKSYYGFENEILDENETQKENMISEEEFKEFETAMKEKYGDDFYTVEEIKKVGKIAEGILDVLNEEIEKLIDKEKNGDKVAADLLNIISELTEIKSLYFDDKDISTDDIESCRAIKLKLESIKKEKTEFEEIIDSILREIYDDDFAKKLVEEDNKQENIDSILKEIYDDDFAKKPVEEDNKQENQNSTEDRKIIYKGVKKDCQNYKGNIIAVTQRKAISHNVDKIKYENKETLGIFKEQSKAYIKFVDDLLAEQTGYVVEKNKQECEVIKNENKESLGIFKEQSKAYIKLVDDLLAEQTGYVVEKNKQECEVIKNTEQSYGIEKENKEYLNDLSAEYFLTQPYMKAKKEIEQNIRDVYVKKPENDNIVQSYRIPEEEIKQKLYNLCKKSSEDKIIEKKENNGIEQKKEFFINSIIDKPEIGKELIKRYIEKYNATYDPIILEKISEIEKILADAERNKGNNDNKEQQNGNFDENPEDNPGTRDDDDDDAR